MGLIAYLAWGRFHQHLRQDIEVKLMETHVAAQGKKNFQIQLLGIHFARASTGPYKLTRVGLGPAYVGRKRGRRFSYH